MTEQCASSFLFLDQPPPPVSRQMSGNVSEPQQARIVSEEQATLPVVA
jgi:hypothetical protein